MVENNNNTKLQDMAHRLRCHSITMTDTSNSGHPTSCMSMAELISVLYFDDSGMHFLPKDPQNPSNDRFVLSKGHAAPIYYAAWAESGCFDVKDLLNLRKIDSDLEGHPTPRLNFVDFATGSLGQGLGNTVGMAYTSLYMDKTPNHYFCLLGDGESAEGSVWEAAFFAGHYNLSNVTVIVDVNRLGQSDPTHLQHDVDTYLKRFESFGFAGEVIDGHDIQSIKKAYQNGRSQKNKPYAIIAKTMKGKYGGDDIENLMGWHGKALKVKELITTIENKMTDKNISLTPVAPKHTFSYGEDIKKAEYSIKLAYEEGKKYSLREGFGFALRKLGENDKYNHIVGLDADVKNSTMSDKLAKAYPDKFINCFIAEQNLASVALGVSKRNKIPYVSTFGTFFTRCGDQIRMGAISQGNVKYVGTHIGCHIGYDGPSQMGLEELSLFRSIPNMTVLAPSDVVSTERAVELSANTYGAFYIRTGRSAHDTLYKLDEKFEIGKCKVLSSSNNDVMTVVSSGAPLHEVIKAADLLKKNGVVLRVIDLFSVKPIDVEGLTKNIKETNNLALVVEDHYYEGGIGEAVKSALSLSGCVIHHQAVNDIPRSGSPEELYEKFGLSSSKLVERINGILKK